MLLDITTVTVLNDNVRPFQTLHKKSLRVSITYLYSRIRYTTLHKQLRAPRYQYNDHGRMVYHRDGRQRATTCDGTVVGQQCR